MKKNMIGIFTKNRIETFSDGIFAIIVTLLVLEIKVPVIETPGSSTQLIESLIKISPKFISWIISFFTVCVIWVNHHRLFKMFRLISHGIFWLNAFLLLWISFIPFPTAMIGDYPDNVFAAAFYGIIMSLMALAFSLMRIYVVRNRSILESAVNFDEFRQGTVYSIIFGPVLYIVGSCISLVHPYLSFGVYAFIAIYFIFPHATKDIE
jgi:uncharacterized membrane protein